MPGGEILAVDHLVYSLPQGDSGPAGVPLVVDVVERRAGREIRAGGGLHECNSVVRGHQNGVALGVRHDGIVRTPPY